MGQILHGSATTTYAIRAAIQRSKASIQALSERYGVNAEDGRQVAQAHERGRPSDGAEDPAVHSALQRGGNLIYSYS